MTIKLNYGSCGYIISMQSCTTFAYPGDYIGVLTTQVFCFVTLNIILLE